MRLDHLLSKEEMLSFVWNNPTKTDEMIPFVWNSPTKTEERSKAFYCCLLLGYQVTYSFLVAMRSGVTPVPIPNTMVKTQAADGTSLETVRESRWPPGYKKLKNTKQIRCKCSGDSYRYRQKMSNNLSVPTLSARKCCYDSWFYQ